MKNIFNFFVIISGALLVCSCSVRDDWEVCGIPPVPSPDSMYVYIAFECIEIYDTGDREIVFDKVTDELELLFYDPSGQLVYDLKYTAAQLRQRVWEVWLHADMVASGKYTLLALVNYGNENYTVTGKESLETLLVGLKYGDPQINFPLTDTYYGRYDLDLQYDPLYNRHKVMLSKNTNLVNLTLIFPDRENYDSILSVESRITGNNTLYDWKNQAVDEPPVSYLPYEKETDTDGFSYTHRNETMRVWHGSDLELDYKIITAEREHGWRHSIPEWLAGIDKYDDNDKLEHYDEFDIKITFGDDFVIVAVQVNGWYVVENGGDL